MFGVGRAKGEARFQSSGGDEGVGQLNAMSEGVLFDECSGRRADRFGKGQNAELKLAERLPDVAGFQPGTRALQEFHQRNDGELSIRNRVDGVRGA